MPRDDSPRTKQLLGPRETNSFGIAVDDFVIGAKRERIRKLADSVGDGSAAVWRGDIVAGGHEQPFARCERERLV